jgi:hypothetical protein
MRYLTFAGLLLASLLTACAINRQPRVVFTPEPESTDFEGARWEHLPVHYCISRSGEGFVDFNTLVQTAKESFQAWGEGAAYDGECLGSTGNANGRNEITWGQLGDPNARLNEAGATNVRYRRVGNKPPEIIEADIVLDSDPPHDQRTLDCLHTTLLHEIGHLYGLPHLSDPAIMAPVINECTSELTAADRNAMRQLYPQP